MSHPFDSPGGDIRYTPLEEGDLVKISEKLKSVLGSEEFERLESLVPMSLAQKNFEATKAYIESATFDPTTLPHLIVYGVNLDNRSATMYIRPEKPTQGAISYSSMEALVKSTANTVIAQSLMPMSLSIITPAVAFVDKDEGSAKSSLTVFSLDTFCRYAFSGFYQLKPDGKIDPASFSTVWPSAPHPLFTAFFETVQKDVDKSTVGSSGWPVIHQDIDIKLS